MAIDQRNKNWNWNTRTGHNEHFEPEHYRLASLAVLMDIRDELQTLNNVFRCHNALAIPQLLRDIKQNTTKKPRRRRSTP